MTDPELAVAVFYLVGCLVLAAIIFKLFDND